jgi:hypothetical protein
MKEVSFVDLDFVDPFLEGSGVYKKRSLSCYTKCAGVYMIKENNNIVYIGMSQSDVVSALYRHFYEWKDVRQYANRVTYFDKLHKKKYTCVILATTKQQAPLFEQSMIITLKPRDNREFYEDVVESLIRQRSKAKEEVLDDLPF